MAQHNHKVLITGSGGFLGRHVTPILQKHFGEQNVLATSSKDVDWMDLAAARAFMEEARPEILVHLAAYSGGIGANREYPADFYFRNTLLTAHGFQLAAETGVRKMLYTMGGCSYPGNATSPIDESQMWQGYPQEESAGYSAAKKMGIVASRSYRTQSALDSVVLIPGNMYGEYDNFREKESHVVPAMVRRYYEAKIRGDQTITMWGSGAPQRDFVYAGDVAAVFPYFIEEYSSSEPVNISSGQTTPIKELAETIAKKMEFKGEILWDTSKPDGQMVKIFDVARLKSLGLSCPTSLDEGLGKTIAWLEKNYPGRTDGIRL
jgi:GDP-L-fucose synthase